MEATYGSNLRIVADKVLQEAQLLVGVPVSDNLLTFSPLTHSLIHF